MLKRGIPWVMVSVTVCLGVSLTINVLQGTRILSLQEDVEQLLVRGELLPGTPLPNLEARDLSGNSYVFEPRSGSKPTILYVFTPSCGWCLRNNDSLKSLTRQVSAKYKIVGLSLSRTDLADYLKVHGIAFPVYTDIRPTTLASYKLGRTPETIVVSPDGTVIQSWVGAYVGGVKTAVEQFFSVQLPPEL
jgi:peroxiredoxin